MSNWCRCGEKIEDSDMGSCYSCKCSDYIKDRDEKDLLKILNK